MRNFALFRDFAADLLRRDPSRRGLSPLVLAVAGAAFEGVGLMLLVPIIAVLGDGSATTSTGGGAMAWLAAYLPAGKVGQLVTLVALFGVLMLLRSIIIVARDVSFAHMNGAFLERTRTRVLDRLVTAGWGRIAGLHHGRVTHLLSADFQACGLAGTSFINLCLSGIMLAILLLVALILSPLLAATALLFLLLLAGILYPTLAAARRSGSTLVELSLKLTSDLSQFLAGLKPALGNNLGRQLLAHIARLQHDQVLHTIAFARQQSLSRAAITVAAGAIGALALLVGGLVLDVSGPKLLAMLVVLARLGGPALQFQQSLQMLLHTLPTYERIKALEADLPAAEGARDGGDATPLPAGPIRFDGVTYLHGEGGRSGGGVRALDLVLAPGDMVAIIGASGAGKTTLADLMAGLIVPQDGSIRVGSALLTPGNADQWRNAIAYVPQDSFLLNDTIRHNLLWGGALASEDELDRVLKTVGADAVVEGRSQGLESPVGERGILLSGGERQRLALARALLRRPRLIILDEATNALDPETEERIVARLAALPDRPTIVAISHRATMLDRFDRVYRMEGGRLG